MCLYVSKIKVLFINVFEVLISVKIVFRWYFIRNVYNILGGNYIGFDVFGLKKKCFDVGNWIIKRGSCVEELVSSIVF